MLNVGLRILFLSTCGMLKVCVTKLKWEPSNEAILNVVPSTQGFIVGIEEDTDTYIKRR